MKLMAVCTSGLGSSFMVEMNIKGILKNENAIDKIESVTHQNLGSTGNGDADYFFVEKSLAEGAMTNFDSEKVIKLDSLIDKKELTTKLNEVLDANGIEHTEG